MFHAPCESGGGDGAGSRDRVEAVHNNHPPHGPSPAHSNMHRNMRAMLPAISALTSGWLGGVTERMPVAGLPETGSGLAGVVLSGGTFQLYLAQGLKTFLLRFPRL